MAGPAGTASDHLAASSIERTAIDPATAVIAAQHTSHRIASADI
jgi:hypothetical protein